MIWIGSENQKCKQRIKNKVNPEGVEQKNKVFPYKTAIHDAKGILTKYRINNKRYKVTYDLDNRISKAKVGNQAVNYRYDALGRRVARKEGSTKTALIWWGNSECAEHKHRAGQTVIQNDIMSHPTRLNAVVARAKQGDKNKLQWYHKNYLDHVYAVSNKRGKLIEHYRYSAFGEIEIFDRRGRKHGQSQINNQITWNTRRLDTLTGYYLYKYRHYDPQLGRWLARDPIGEDGSRYNLYAFVGNEPIYRFDVDGRWAWVGQLGIGLTSSLTASSIYEAADDQSSGRSDNFPDDFKVGVEKDSDVETACEKGTGKYSLTAPWNYNSNAGANFSSLKINITWELDGKLKATTVSTRKSGNTVRAGIDDDSHVHFFVKKIDHGVDFDVKCGCREGESWVNLEVRFVLWMDQPFWGDFGKDYVEVIKIKTNSKRAEIITPAEASHYN